MTAQEATTSNIRTVSIRPGVSVLSVLQHLNYKPWFALAEFVDNSLQSFLTHREPLRALHGGDVRLRVQIEIHGSPSPRIIIRDNAAGISAADYQRAFRPAAVPPNRTGLSEFGMGMKSAACWFSPRWHVRTKALGEQVRRKIDFDIDQIVTDDISELDIEEMAAPANEHSTEVVLDKLHHQPVGRTVAKIKEHLTDIYRVYVREGILELSLDGRALQYEEPEILRAPYFRNLDEEPRLWRKDIEFDFGDGLRAHGFAGIRSVGSTSRAGFSLFRRGRLIQGSGDEGYRPHTIFGNSNSYRYQRLFGELHLEGFEVAHTKDGFKWDENEQPFLDILKEHLDSEDMPLLNQAEGHRTNRLTLSQLTSAATEAISSTAGALEEGLPRALDAIAAQPERDPAQELEPPPTELPEPEARLASRTIDTRFRSDAWRITLELTNDSNADDWVQISDQPAASAREQPRLLGLRVSLAHPFMVRFAGANAEDIDALLRVAAALGIAEVVTREMGLKGSSIFMQNINDIIREALSQP